jgi:ankyrin repeat protein
MVSGETTFIDACLNKKAHQGPTPLHYAASSGNPEVVQLLLDRGALIEAADDSKYTPLNVAAEENMCDALIALLNNGADVEGSELTASPLIHAANQG